jgi:S-disulfanyl-L-cysteine oxidoreductase SoxD
MFSAIIIVAAVLSQNPSSVLDGVYTPAQAARGEDAYRTNCTGCHEGNEPDGPLLTGPTFIDRWREDNLNTLFTHIRTNMPGNRPGSLSENTYLDILAYLLEANGLPPGARELTAEIVGTTQLVDKDGPKPLPTNSTVRIVGCLAQGPTSTWILEMAGTPVRVKDIEQSTPQELKDSATIGLGSQTIRLQNVPDSADSIKGHKVQAKGVLIRQNNNDRINVTSLETVAPSCS